MKETDRLRFSWVTSITEVDGQEWDRLALPLDTPLLEYGWLSLLESSGSACPETGWLPRFLLARRGGELIAACPLFVRISSEGEFVYDYFWAEAAGIRGLPYFPKLVGMSPFTPVSAYQFLLAEGEAGEEIVPLLCHEIRNFAAAHGIPGIHFQYVHPDWVERFTASDFIHWKHPCYVWTNPGYGSFDEFLSVLSKNTRRNVRREEESLRRKGIRLEIISNDAIDPAWHETMYRFYLSTNEKFGIWACLFLTEEFFKGIFRSFRHRLAVSAAFRGSEKEPVGMALFLRKGERLWGRYWGCREYIPDLHFNVCYYAPIRWAIKNRIKYFDPGIGTEHKARRGFTAWSGSSVHAFLDPRMQALFRYNIGKLNSLARSEIRKLNRGSAGEE